jgi:hypothetical protein
MGAMLQQHVKNAWEPLAFFLKKLNPEAKLTAAPPPSTPR